MLIQLKEETFFKIKKLNLKLKLKILKLNSKKGKIQYTKNTKVNTERNKEFELRKIKREEKRVMSVMVAGNQKNEEKKKKRA